jgi:hypothetical protein
MRHQNQPEVEPITRLLLQKPKAFAELDEMSRMAISVLTDDGWKIERIGLEVRVWVTATPVSQPGADEALAEAQAKFILLRKELTDSHGELWLAMMLAFVVAAFMSAIGAGLWIWTLSPVCFLCYFIARRMNGAA